MIRLLENRDIQTICQIVNDNWKSVYKGYVNEELLNNKGCLERKNRLNKDFKSGRLTNYIYEQNGQPIALLSVGKTTDEDKSEAYELWRIYIQQSYQGKGIGSQLIEKAELEALRNGYKEMIIWAFKENTPAIKFYKKHGYQQEMEQYLGKPYEAYGVRLVKKLRMV
ncbi:GNAT family N-acetyltransferase [Anaeromicropila herbilytica]|uniref:N-acetyltransferase domain-containing protein n=1 Tax=Anaeromicropila herbilytica TaxID=2785025 RepID=A0A7R7EN49_9FIRM|nr:GNAT family N-acetyltransferase [Anaeromicropila herbilytica]BCN31843.1 hypothetical protein bsdtb5_31380 [Anaeromicropila herbilytica]